MAISEVTYSSNAGLAADKSLRPFLVSSFDPVEFLNATLPSWTPASALRQANSSSASEQTQALLSQLNAQLSRLSNTLTQLTDEILRSGSRLAYDVEVLRGDTSSLSDVLTQGLRHDIEKFVPLGLAVSADGVSPNVQAPFEHSQTVSGAVETANAPNVDSPDYIEKLHTLSLVRSRLDTVVKVFGDALEWVIPPSRSSTVNIVAAETDQELDALEMKSKAYAEKVRLELSYLLESGEADAVQTALDRVEAFRVLTEVWKGTAEEKTRVAFVESLVEYVHQNR